MKYVYIYLLTAFVSAFAMSSSYATIVTECYPWQPSGEPDTVATDCILEIYGEPVIPDVDTVAISMWANSQVYLNGQFQEVAFADNAVVAPYPGTQTQFGYPYLEIFTNIYALYVLDGVNVEHNPHCWNAEWLYRAIGTGSWNFYTDRYGCGHWIGLIQQ